MRVLVTGADGFVAGHLLPLLRESGHEVVGTALDPDTGAAEGVPVHALDVTDGDAARALVARLRPTRVVHLAAVSSVRWSFEHPAETQRVNVDGTRNVLDAAAVVPEVRVLVVGSGEEYGPNDGRPLSELPVSALKPLSPYAESKVAVERLIEAEPRYRQLAIRTRSFPHFGPGQQTGFFVADISSQLVQIERGERPSVLRVGNLDAVRDYTDVRDVVRAYALLLERGVPGEVYNVCSGVGVSMRALLDRLAALSGVEVRVEADPEKLRPSEIPALVGDNAKLRAATGWSPEVPLDQSLRDILAAWRETARVSP